MRYAEKRKISAGQALWSCVVWGRKLRCCDINNKIILGSFMARDECWESTLIFLFFSEGSFWFHPVGHYLEHSRFPARATIPFDGYRTDTFKREIFSFSFSSWRCRRSSCSASKFLFVLYFLFFKLRGVFDFYCLLPRECYFFGGLHVFRLPGIRSDQEKKENGRRKELDTNFSYSDQDETMIVIIYLIWSLGCDGGKTKMGRE